MTEKAQATLEFTLVFIIAVALIAGLLNMWVWSKNQIWARQGAYEGSRVAAGTNATAGEPSGYGASPLSDKDIYLFKK